MSQKQKAMWAVLIGDAIFGFSFLFSKLVLDLTIPSVLIAVRFTVAFLVLNLILFVGKLLHKTDFSLKGKSKKYIFFLGIFQPIIYFAAENYGIVFTSSVFAGIIIAMIPISGLIFDVIIMHAKVTKLQVICAICSVIGVVITSLGAGEMNSSAIGIVVLLIAVVAASLFYVFSKKAAAEYSPLERTYVMFGMGSVFYIIMALVQCRKEVNTLILAPMKLPIFWIAVLYLAVASSVIAFLLLNFGASHISVTQASLFANITTVISIFAGIFILHEPFSWQQGVGAVIILASVYFAK